MNNVDVEDNLVDEDQEVKDEIGNIKSNISE